MPNSWFVIIDGEQLGPLTGAALKQLAMEGKVKPDTQVSTSEGGETVPASRVKGLFNSGKTAKPRKNIFYQAMGEVFGPVSGVELRQKAVEQTIRPDTLVRVEVDGEWVPASRVRGLFDGNENPMRLRTPPPVATRRESQAEQENKRRTDSVPASLTDAHSSEQTTAGNDTGGLGSVKLKSDIEEEHQFRATQWYVTVEGEQKGPLTATEILRWIQEGKVDPDTFVRAGADGEWLSARCYNRLFEQEHDEQPAEALSANEEAMPLMQAGLAPGEKVQARSPKTPLLPGKRLLPALIGIPCVLVLLITGILVWRAKARADYERISENTKQELEALAEEVNRVTLRATKTLSPREANSWYELSKLVEQCGQYHRRGFELDCEQGRRDDKAIKAGFREEKDGYSHLYRGHFKPHVNFPAFVSLLDRFATNYYKSWGKLPWEVKENKRTSDIMDDIISLIAYQRDEGTWAAELYLKETIGKRVLAAKR